MMSSQGLLGLPIVTVIEALLLSGQKLKSLCLSQSLSLLQDTKYAHTAAVIAQDATSTRCVHTLCCRRSIKSHNHDQLVQYPTCRWVASKLMIRASTKSRPRTSQTEVSA